MCFNKAYKAMCYLSNTIASVLINTYFTKFFEGMHYPNSSLTERGRQRTWKDLNNKTNINLYSNKIIMAKQWLNVTQTWKGILSSQAFLWKMQNILPFSSADISSYHFLEQSMNCNINCTWNVSWLQDLQE